MAQGIDCTLLLGHVREACIAANKVAGQDEHGNPLPGGPQQPTGLPGEVSGALGSATSGISDISSAVTGFFSTVLDYRMWRSLGWLFLGGVLIAISMVMFARGAAVKTVSRTLRGK